MLSPEILLDSQHHNPNQLLIDNTTKTKQQQQPTMESSPIDLSKLPEYTSEEVARHDGGVALGHLRAAYDVETDEAKKQDLSDAMSLCASTAWIIIHGLIFDVTDFRKKHPAGEYVINSVVGKNATQDFEDSFHSIRARGLLRALAVGRLKGYPGDIMRPFRRK